jgi:MFS transporter, OFA family, oxalate/formate antiporter
LRKYIIAGAAVLIELLLGFQYTWAIFDRVLQARHGFTATQAQAVLAAQIVTFALTFPVAGWVLHHIGPRLTTIIGGAVYGTSLLLGAKYGQNPSALFWSAGVLFGAGLALAYICPIVTIQKWFPRYKGVATGLVVACYGSSSFLLAYITKALLARGMTVFEILGVFGIAALCGVLPLGLVLANPPHEAGAPKRGRFPAGVLKTGHFWALTVAYFAGTTAGLSIVGSIEKIGGTLQTPEWWVAGAVMAFAAGNTLGRVAWGFISEWLGTRRTVCSALATLGGSILAMTFFGSNGAAFIALTFGIGFGYGANFVLYITDVSRTYGPDRVGSVYGLVALVYIASGLFGAPSAGRSYDLWHSYAPSMYGAAALTLVGLVMFLVLHGQPVEEDHGESIIPAEI